jgi:hypothetical protein
MESCQFIKYLPTESLKNLDFNYEFYDISLQINSIDQVSLCYLQGLENGYDFF